MAPPAETPELREAIARKLSAENGVPTTAAEVMVTNGGKQAIYNLFQVLLNPGDEVLIPAPYWLSYPEMASLAQARPVFVPSSAASGFALDLEALEAAITPASRLLVINSPGNPTGRVLSLEELNGLAELVRRHPRLMVMTDEIYEYLLEDGVTHHSFAAVAPDLKERCFLVNGFAKGWAMTGWRLGYLSGHAAVIKAASALQSQSTSNVCSFAQRGALAAIEGSRACVRRWRRVTAHAGVCSPRACRLAGITLIPPTGRLCVPAAARRLRGFDDVLPDRTGARGAGHCSRWRLRR